MSSKKKAKKQPTDDDYYNTIGQININNDKFISELVHSFIPRTDEAIKKSFQDHLKNTLKCSKKKIDKFSAYLATSYSIRDRLIQFFNVTMNYFLSCKAKQLNFVSSEFLMGRFLRNAILNLQLENSYKDMLKQFNLNLEDIYEEEYDQGPGSNGNGRFAACMLDSLATLNYPAWSYGIYYSKGYFQQKFSDDGQQLEDPDYFFNYIEPWCIKRPLISHQIGFGGKFNQETQKWQPEETIQAVANDFLIPGYQTINTLTLRLWSSEYNNQYENNSKNLAQLTESIYPSDSDDENVISMRLKQEYFLSSASVQDIVLRLKYEQHASIHDLPKFISIHINDTQPCLMALELLRILIDDEKMEFDEAFSIVKQSFSFTCQTLIPMTFERFPLPIFEKILPRHLLLIYEINERTLSQVHDNSYKTDMSIIEESNPKQIRMINLAIICSHNVIGVSKSQTNMLTETLFEKFNKCYPGKFLNITSGISIRRWLHHCNKPLSKLITQSLSDDDSWPIFNTANENNIHLGSKKKNNSSNQSNNYSNNSNNYSNNNENDNDDDSDDDDDFAVNSYLIDSTNKTKDLSSTIEALHNLIEDPSFIKEFSEIKYKNKVKLADLVNTLCGVELDPDLQLFDVQAKEFKHNHRQTLHIFSIIHRYLELSKKNEIEKLNYYPRAFIIAGKASPASTFLKSLVLLINRVADVINSDESLHSILRVAFIPNYNVSIAETLVAGADVNVQISTPGTEAAATSNMKFALNGSLIIGTNDGTNTEIADEIGENNIYFCGLPYDVLEDARNSAENPIIDPELKMVFDAIRSNQFGPSEEYEEILRSIEHQDYFLVNAEFEDYLTIQSKVDADYQNGIFSDFNNENGNETNINFKIKRVAAIPHIGKFSSDKEVVDYAEKIWDIKQYPLPIKYLSENDVEIEEEEEEFGK